MDKKEGMNRWKLALLLGGGLAAALLWGCFNPIMSAPDPGSADPGSENQGSEDQGSTDPGDGPGPNDGMAGEFTVVLRVGDGGPETGSRSVVGPDADDIRYKGVWNTVQVIAADAETQEVKDNQLVNLDNENDSSKTIWVDVAQGKRYHILVLMGHTELNYANKDPKYEYKSDPPTLLAAGFLEDQAIHGQATLNVTMKPLVVDTVFKHGDFTKPAVLPDEKGEAIQLPAKVAASVVWTVTGGFATLVDAQTRTGLPGGLNWGGLALTGKTFIRNGADLLEPTPVMSGADHNQIVLDLGAQNAAGTSGSANFKLTYNPLGEAETWIIRNGINDDAQDKDTTFTLENEKIPWSTTKNGNGAVVFEFADQKISDIDLTGLVPAPVTGGVPAKALSAGAYTYETEKVEWKGAGAAKSTTLFEGGTVYVATVTLKPAEGFRFRTATEGGVTVTHGGSSVILDIPQTNPQEVMEKKVYFPETGVFWEQHGGYFSGEDAVKKDSAIDIMKLAADFSSLSLKLLPWQEEVDFNAQDRDIGAGLVLKAGENSPAAVTLDGGGDTIMLTGSGTGSIITVDNGVTLTLRNITFKGKAGNNAALIKVNQGGKLVLQDGAVITGNINSISGGGVAVTGNGKLDMTGGEISGNTAGTYGGGVYVTDSGEFTMSGGTISGNKATAAPSYGGGVSVGGVSFVMTGGVISGNNATYGGGVHVRGSSTFTMHNGEISRNTAGAMGNGGGVDVRGSSTFTMHNGVISGNIAPRGGGVQVTDTTFTMNGGKISGNTANDSSNGMGGGVRVSNSTATFTMNNGEISGNTAVNGGGVYFAAKTFTMHRGIIYGNEDENGDKKNTAPSGGAAFYKYSGEAKWDEDKKGTLVELDTSNNTTLDLR